jgi:hypothetical protein
VFWALCGEVSGALVRVLACVILPLLVDFEAIWGPCGEVSGLLVRALFPFKVKILEGHGCMISRWHAPAATGALAGSACLLL